MEREGRHTAVLLDTAYVTDNIVMLADLSHVLDVHLECMHLVLGGG